MTGVLTWFLATFLIPIGDFIVPISILITSGVYIYFSFYKKQLLSALKYNIFLTLFVIAGGIWCVLSLCGLAGWFNLSKTYGVDFSYLPRQAYYFFFLPLIAFAPFIKKDKVFDFVKKYNIELATGIYLILCMKTFSIHILNVTDYFVIAFLSLLGNRKRKLDLVLGAVLVLMPFPEGGGSTVALLKIIYIGLFVFKNAKWVMKLATLTIPVILIFSFIIPQVTQVVDQISEANDKWRLNFWADSTNTIIDSYGVGIGYGTTYGSKELTEPFKERYILNWPYNHKPFFKKPTIHYSTTPFSTNDYYTKEQRPFVTATHNSFVAIGLRMGVVGIVLFCGFLFLLWKTIYKKRDDEQAALAFLFCGSLIFISLNVGLESPVFFNMFMIAMMAISNQTSKNIGKPKNINGKHKILHILYGVDTGGLEAVVYNYFNNINRQKFHFDLIVQDETVNDKSNYMFAKKLKQIGAKIYYVPPKSENLVKCMSQSVAIIKKNKYDIVHIHMGYASTPYVFCARVCGVENVIVHTHIAFDNTGWSKKHSIRIMGAILKCLSTHKMACGIDAATEAWPNENVYILNNAVKLDDYTVSQEKIDQIKKDLRIEDVTAICAVARFTESKNHKFLIDVFAEYLKINSKAKLVLIGTGELQSVIMQKVQTMQLENNVLFLGARTDVPSLLQAMDVFVLPSTFEGFGIVYIEAQLAGLPTLALKGAVPDAVNISTAFELLPKEATPKQWAEKISTALDNKPNQAQTVENARRQGFDITYETKKLEEYYENMLKEE